MQFDYLRATGQVVPLLQSDEHNHNICPCLSVMPTSIFSSSLPNLRPLTTQMLKEVLKNTQTPNNIMTYETSMLDLKRKLNLNVSLLTS